MHHFAQRDPTFTAKARSTWEILRRVGFYLRPYKLMAVGTIGCALLSQAFALTYPELNRGHYDNLHLLTTLPGY